MNNTIVSISCISYNQAPYIRQCLDSFLMQKTSFAFEIIIHDDASTDGTKEIIEEYVAKYPDIIFPMYQKENQYSKGVRGMMVRFNFPRCIGKYIALCEGDDYWTDPYKLQKQVDFLEENADYILSFHGISILQTDGKLEEDFITKIPENHETQETLARFGNYIHTPSVVFRNVIKEFPPEFAISPIGDYFLYMILTEYGKLNYMNEKMGVYRAGVGIWSSKSDYYRNFNMSYANALLANFFNSNEKISSILTDRIIFFLTRFEDYVTSADLIKLSINRDVNEKVLKYFIYNIKSLKTRKNYDDSTKNLIKVLMKRIVKKITKI
ncbi:glycosyltransferase [Flavobacterium sp. 245]|uniref:glycosyltransferase n=1 Tax=Flavobacterium sp. 245 TaxID=2512115 RepID=UPI0010614D60|nr:glycosyltransferase [Flavobacterium sp. 245]TDP00883.1 glycosyltransferase involved in cell wall biosynthesis [Flavobacterium sp. 245]